MENLFAAVKLVIARELITQVNAKGMIQEDVQSLFGDSDKNNYDNPLWLQLLHCSVCSMKHSMVE